MKQIILLLALVSSTCMLFSQTNVKPGSDILKYKLYRDKDDVFFVLQDLEN